MGLSLPKLITLLRLLSVPVIVSLMLGGDYYWAFVIFLAAGLSDAVDRFLAKRFGMVTELGAYLDPIADKALLVSVYVTLGVQGQLWQTLVVLVVSRDLLIVGAVMLSYYLGHRLKIAPLMISKINTAAQIVLAALVLAALGHWPALAGAVFWCQWLVAATTVLSGLLYFLAWFASVSAWERDGRPGPP